MFVAIYVMNSCDATVINLPTKQWTATKRGVNCYRPSSGLLSCCESTAIVPNVYCYYSCKSSFGKSF